MRPDYFSIRPATGCPSRAPAHVATSLSRLGRDGPRFRGSRFFRSPFKGKNSRLRRTAVRDASHPGARERESFCQTRRRTRRGEDEPRHRRSGGHEALRGSATPQAGATTRRADANASWRGTAERASIEHARADAGLRLSLHGVRARTAPRRVGGGSADFLRQRSYRDRKDPGARTVAS